MTTNKIAPEVALERIAHELADPDWTLEILNRVAEIVIAAGYKLTRRSVTGEVPKETIDVEDED